MVTDRIIARGIRVGQKEGRPQGVVRFVSSSDPTSRIRGDDEQVGKSAAELRMGWRTRARERRRGKQEQDDNVKQGSGETQRRMGRR
jgi:hypothetical protein